MEAYIVAIAVGILIGYLADRKYKQKTFGLVPNLITGVVGAVACVFIFGLFNITITGIVGALILPLIGSIILLGVVSLFKKKKG